MNDLKYTIINMLKNKLDILITNTPINNEYDIDNLMLPRLLFKKYIGDNFNIIQVINYDKYVNYRSEEVEKFNNIDISGLKLIDNNGNILPIKKYDNDIGVIYLDSDIKNLLEYNDTFCLSDSEYNCNKKDKDFIYVYSAYNYSNTMNKNTVEHYDRINIDIFIYNDLDTKSDYYCNVIHKLFERDFIIYNKDGKKVNVAHIQTQLSFSLSEYNISNKILRGTMLIKTYQIK